MSASPPQLLSQSRTANWTVQLIVRPPEGSIPDSEPAEDWCIENIMLDQDGQQTWYSYYVGWIAGDGYAFMFHFDRQVDAAAFKIRWG